MRSKNFGKGLFSAQSKAKILGVPQKGDILLWQEMVNKHDTVLGFTAHTLYYPPENSTHNKRAVINCLAIMDIKGDEMGGVADIVSGGVGAESVTIQMTSRYSRRMKFQVFIIGKYIQNKKLNNDLNVNNNESIDRKVSFNFNSYNLKD